MPIHQKANAGVTLNNEQDSEKPGDKLPFPNLDPFFIHDGK
jgi:hypothetical protein